MDGVTEVTDHKWCLYDVNPGEHKPVDLWGGLRVLAGELSDGSEPVVAKGQVVGFYWTEELPPYYHNAQGHTAVLVGDYCVNPPSGRRGV